MTNEQIRQLNMYSVYLTEPTIPLFTLGDLLQDNTQIDMAAVQAISDAPNETVAVSYFMRRWGMFISMQFYLLTSSNVVWDGKVNVRFGTVEEFGLRTIGTFVQAEDFRVVGADERQAVIRQILKEQCFDVITKIRRTCTVSPLTLWENIFGYLIWHYHVFSSSPSISSIAKKDWESLCSNELWEGIAKQSLFAKYTGGLEPSSLLNRPVRKSCCFSKDVPGLMKCTYCPLT